MREHCRRVTTCALIVMASGGIMSAQQGRSQAQSRAESAAAAGGVATSFDSDGVPRFVVATDSRSGPLGATHEGAAHWHLTRFSRAHNVTPTDLAAAAPVAVQTLNSGDVIVEMRQRVGGLDVVGSEVKVLMHGDHRLVAISGRPRATNGADTRVSRSPEDALAAALSERFGTAVAASSIASVTTPSGERRFRIADGAALVMPEAAPVRAVLFPSGSALVAAYTMDFYAGTTDSGDSGAYRYVIAAATVVCSSAAI